MARSLNLDNITNSTQQEKFAQTLTFDFYYIRDCAKTLYEMVAIKQKTAILYKPLSEEKFKRINTIIKPGLEIIEYKREFAGVRFDVAYWWGHNDYAINYTLPDGKIFHKVFTSCTLRPVLYDKPFGMEFSDYVRAQQGMKYILEEQHIDNQEFIIEENENWPHYFFANDKKGMVCVPHFLVMTNMELKDIKKV